MKDGIHRAVLRGDSLYMRTKVVAAAELLRGTPLVEAGKKWLIETRQRVKAGWLGVSDTLIRQGQSFFASEVRRFADAMPDVRTDTERIAETLADLARARQGASTRAQARDREAG